jgi:hypothetical protein
MAKKQLTEEEKSEKKLQKLAVIYGQVDGELHIAGKPINEQIHILVDKCNALQTEICQMADSIKIEDLTKVQDITDIDKKTYLDFVNICALKSNDKLKEKAIAKFESDFENRLFISNLRHSFLESYMSGYDLKITDEDNQEYKPYSDYKSEEFERIMEDSAKTRMFINDVLYKQYKKYAAAAEYITKLELNYGDFKKLVDWEHYKEGGYPTPTTPAKLWSIFEKYNNAIRLMEKYEFTQQKDLNKEFGLNVELAKPSPVKHPWMLTEPEESEIDE